MRRPLRWLFTLAAAFPAVLCAGSVALWLRSAVVADQIDWVFSRSRGEPRGLKTLVIVSDRGMLLAEVEREELAPSMMSTGGWPKGPRSPDFSRSTSDTADPAAAGPAPPLTPAYLHWEQRFDYNTPDHISHSVTSGHDGELLARMTGTGARVPYWLAAAAGAAGCAPAAFAARRRLLRRRRERRGGCAGCGYDLRGTDSARCSECGALRPAAVAAAAAATQAGNPA